VARPSIGLQPTRLSCASYEPVGTHEFEGQGM
jgi:hypothetical protein